jgi:hypothetical protein
MSYERDQNGLLWHKLEPKNYQCDQRLANVANWRARVLAGNSLDANTQVGDMDEVGYVMIRCKGPISVISILRCDEHHMGMELLHDNAKKWGVDPAEWLPVFAQNGCNYVEREGDIPICREAMRRWHAVGGPERLISIRGAGVHRTYYRVYVGSAKFIDEQRWGEARKNPLLDFGQRLVDGFAEISDMLTPNGLIDPNYRPANRKALAAKIAALVQNIDLVQSAFWGVFEPWGSVTEGPGVFLATCDRLIQTGQWQELEQVIFGFNGLHNRVHQVLRTANEYDLERLSNVCGDVSAMIGIMSAGRMLVAEAPSP